MIRRDSYLNQFLSVSNGSCGKVRSQAYRAFDFKYITQADLDTLLEGTDKISRKTISLINHLKKSEITGIKFKKP